MNPLDLFHLQVRLEGREVVHGSLLRQVEVVPDEEMPLMVIALLSPRELVAYYDEALSPELRNSLSRQIHSLNFPSVDPLIEVLQPQYPYLETGHFKTYTFPEHYKDFTFDEVNRFPKTDPKVQAFGFGDFAGEVYAIEKNGKIISAFVSTRENGFCGEAWVYTDIAYRNQGFAQKVVGAWSNELISAGKIPFYSYKVQNKASANLASRLGLQPVF